MAAHIPHKLLPQLRCGCSCILGAPWPMFTLSQQEVGIKR